MSFYFNFNFSNFLNFTIGLMIIICFHLSLVTDSVPTAQASGDASIVMNQVPQPSIKSSSQEAPSMSKSTYLKYNYLLFFIVFNMSTYNRK